ncbi:MULTISPECIES: methyl-accepting chemotaxis protein [Pseudomonadaceae]|uniref:methyl-accepting chemotaxis protein n=1 Tax=Pseudomonadaceae TaxID=135621 RepID=UPI0011C043F0|nr:MULTISPECIES: methyl-accepting chemotaxis protein [Pseudomonas]
MGRDELFEESDDVRTTEQLTPHDRCRLEHEAGLADVPIADRLADGDFTQRIDPEGHDETVAPLRAMDGLNQRLSQIITDVLSGSGTKLGPASHPHAERSLT